MQFIIISMAFADFCSDLTWGLQVLIVGGKPSVFGYFSLGITFGIMIYNARAMQSILHKDGTDSREDWGALNENMMREHRSLYAVLTFLAYTDMEVLCLMPWRKDCSRGADGFPDRAAVIIAHRSGYIEDFTQLMVQIAHASRRKAHLERPGSQH